MATPEDIATALRYGPRTAQFVRRSAYLEDALKAMQEQGGQNIRSPWELASKLAATALLSRGANKARDATLEAVRADQKERMARMLAGLEDSPQPAPAAAAPPPPVSPAPPVGPVASAPLPPAQPAPAPANFSLPVDGRVTSGFGVPRPGGRSHNGVDLAVPSGTEVKAPADGEVIAIGSDPASGNFVRLRHADGSVSSFGHLTAAGVKVGDRVPAGATFATSGATGRATGPHVHYVHRDPQGRAVDPMSLGPAPQAPQMSVPPPPAPPNPMGPPDQPALPYQVAAAGATPPPPMPPSASGSSPPAAGNPVAAPPAAAGNPNPWQERIDLIKRLAMSPRLEDQQQAEKLYADLLVQRTKPPEYTYNVQGAYQIASDKNDPTHRQVTRIPELATEVLTPQQAQQLGITAPPGSTITRDNSGNIKIEKPSEGQMVVSRPGEPYRESYIPGSKGDPRREQPPQPGYQYVGPNRMAVIPGSKEDPTNTGAIMQATAGLRDEMKPTLTAAISLRRNFNAILAGYKLQNGQGDIAILTGLQKLSDEGVVQSGEINNQLRALGFTGGIEGAMQWLKGGGLFSPAARRQLMMAGQSVYSANNDMLRAQAENLRAVADAQYGPGTYDRYILTPQTATTLGWVKAPAGASAAPGGGAPPPPQIKPGTPDAGIAEAVKRRLPLTKQQQDRARELGLIR